MAVSVAVWWLMTIFLLVFSLAAIIGFFGLTWKKQWGRLFSIFAMGLMALFVLWFVVMIVVSEYQQMVSHPSVTDIITLLIMLILIASSILSFIYLLKPRVKALFKNKPALS
jgi:hypothetical protein